MRIIGEAEGGANSRDVGGCGTKSTGNDATSGINSRDVGAGGSSAANKPVWAAECPRACSPISKEAFCPDRQALGLCEPLSLLCSPPPSKLVPQSTLFAPARAHFCIFLSPWQINPPKAKAVHLFHWKTRTKEVINSIPQSV